MRPVTPRSTITRLNYSALSRYQEQYPEYPDVPIILNRILETITKHESALDFVYGDSEYQRFRSWISGMQFIGQGSYGSAFVAKLAGGPLAIIVKVSPSDLEPEYRIGKLINVLIERQVCPNFTYTYSHFVGSRPSFVSDGTILLTSYQPNVDYLVREYVPGKTFTQFIIECNQGSVTDIVQIMIQCLLAIQAAHHYADGFTHWDLKPDNIIIVELPSSRELKYRDYTLHTRYLAKIVDYGTASIAADRIFFQTDLRRVSRIRRSASVGTIPVPNGVQGGTRYTGFQGRCEPIYDAIRLSLLVIWQLKSDHKRELGLGLDKMLRELLVDIGVPRYLVEFNTDTLFCDLGELTRQCTIPVFVEKLLGKCIENEVPIGWITPLETPKTPRRVLSTLTDFITDCPTVDTETGLTHQLHTGNTDNILDRLAAKIARKTRQIRRRYKEITSLLALAPTTLVMCKIQLWISDFTFIVGCAVAFERCGGKYDRDSLVEACDEARTLYETLSILPTTPRLANDYNYAVYLTVVSEFKCFLS